jgi:fucose permease
LIAGRVREEVILHSALVLLAAVLISLLLFGRWESVAVICAFFAGMGCAPIFPTTFAIVQRLFPASFGAVSGLLLMAGNASVVFLPWLQGRISAGRDGGMILPLLGTLTILVITLSVTRETRRQEAASAAHPAPVNPSDR